MPLRFVFSRVVPAVTLLLVGTLGVTYYLYGALRHASLSLIDDHEILRYLGRIGGLDIQDVPATLMSETEVGHWGERTRLRPAYYLFRILEAAIHGDDAGQWYLTRMVFVAFCGFAIGALVLRSLVNRTSSWLAVGGALVLAAIASTLVVTLPAWTDVAMRLGPSEIYVSFGVAIYLWGVREAWCLPARVHGWILLALGYLVIAGSKEDGLLFLPPLLVLVVLRFAVMRHRALVIVLAMISTGFSAYIAIGLLRGAAASGGTDMYGNSRSFGLFLANMVGNQYVFATLLFLVVALAADAVLDRRTAREVAHGWWSRFVGFVSRWPHALAAALAVYIVLGDGYFYQAYFANGAFLYGRYGFLTEFAVVAGAIVGLVALFRVLAGSAAGFSPVRAIAVATAAIVLITPPLGTQVLHARASYRSLSKAIAADTTAVFAQVQAGVQDIISREEGVDIVLIVDEASDYERVFSLPQFLHFYAGTEAVFLNVAIPKEAIDGRPIPPTDSLSLQLAEELEEMEFTGRLTDGWRIRAKQALGTGGAICFFFGAPPQDVPRCDSLHGIG